MAMGVARRTRRCSSGYEQLDEPPDAGKTSRISLSEKSEPSERGRFSVIEPSERLPSRKLRRPHRHMMKDMAFAAGQYAHRSNSFARWSAPRIVRQIGEYTTDAVGASMDNWSELHLSLIHI